MARFCREVPGIRMASLLERAVTPVLAPARLADLGYHIAAYPLTLLASAVPAMVEALGDLAAGRTTERRADFAAPKRVLGFAECDGLLATYEHPRGQPPF
jgi:2-methylisocitrate lyase-like PEP mutase family enzyme